MEIVLLTANAFALPTARRATVLFHDGPTDFRLWPGPSLDRDVTFAYGDLEKALKQEGSRLPGKALSKGELLRLHPGKLHCDYLLYGASRDPEQNSKRSAAPSAETITQLVKKVLAYADERGSARVAFGLVGEGPDSIRDAERMATIARACHAYEEEKGRAAAIEEVVVCAPIASITGEARRLLGASVRAQIAPEEVKATYATRSPAKAPAKPRSESKPAPKRIMGLSPDEVARARATAQNWDRAKRYAVGDYFLHLKFGVGKVVELTTDGFVNVLFEDHETRKLVHQR